MRRHVDVEHGWKWGLVPHGLVVTPQATASTRAKGHRTVNPRPRLRFGCGVGRHLAVEALMILAPQQATKSYGQRSLGVHLAATDCRLGPSIAAETGCRVCSG